MEARFQTTKFEITDSGAQNSQPDQRLKRILDSWKDWGVENGDYPVILRTLSDGLTNKSIVVQCGAVPLVVRLNRIDSASIGINRRREALILNKVSEAGLGPKLFFSSQGTYLQSLNFSILEYIQGHAWQQESFYNSKNISKLKVFIEKYRSLNFDISDDITAVGVENVNTLTAFNYAEHIEGYWKQLSEQNPNTADRLCVDYLSFRQRLIQFQEKSWKPVLTHHDLIPENIIENDNGLMIIDWEYAGLGHPSFDSLFIDAFSKKDPSTSDKYLEDQDIVEEIIYWINTLWFCLTSET